MEDARCETATERYDTLAWEDDMELGMGEGYLGSRETTPASRAGSICYVHHNMQASDFTIFYYHLVPFL